MICTSSVVKLRHSFSKQYGCADFGMSPAVQVQAKVPVSGIIQQSSLRHNFCQLCLRMQGLEVELRTRSTLSSNGFFRFVLQIVM